MSKLPRPYIPYSVRVAVAEQQMAARGHAVIFSPPPSNTRQRLAELLRVLFGEQPPGEPLQLDHDPPLAGRIFNPKTQRYKPDANDPRFLIWRTKADHKRKTYLRGDGGQFSDRILIKRERRRKREEAPAPVSAFKAMMAEAIEKRKEFAKRNKRKWPSRPFPRRASGWDKRRSQ